MSNIIQLTAPCRQCFGKGEIMEVDTVGLDVSSYEVVRCGTCHGSGHVVRECLLELRARIRHGKRKRSVLNAFARWSTGPNRWGPA